jgi:hypothetical protein
MPKSDANWVIQDHLPGELADFIALRESGNRVEVNIVHCKKPAGAPSTRVTDIQELLAQAMRSMYLATRRPVGRTMPRAPYDALRQPSIGSRRS